jgi:gliding motility-associated-like protein
MVTGLDEGVGASECSFSVEVSGPALEYDLDLSYFPEGDPDRTNQNIYEGETVILSAGDGFNDVEWSGPELNSLQGNEVTADPEGVDVFIPYTAIAEIDGCTFTESIEVYIAPAIQASNAFSPNGDGINDTWEIQNIDDWPNAQIFVYSRWGNKVFQTTNYSNDWGGDDLPSATYYYVIELNPIDFNAEPITGSVTIMR